MAAIRDLHRNKYYIYPHELNFYFMYDQISRLVVYTAGFLQVFLPSTRESRNACNGGFRPAEIPRSKRDSRHPNSRAGLRHEKKLAM